MKSHPITAETMLDAVEDELFASCDDDLLAAPSAARIAERMSVLVAARIRPVLDRQALPARVPARRNSRARAPQRGPKIKREMVDRVLVASPAARALVEPAEVATLSDEELDHLLARMRALGLLTEE